MRQSIGLRAGLLLIGLGAVAPAAAQSVYVPPGLPNVALPPYEIMRVVSSHGFTPVTRPVRRGPNYILLATDRSGQQMRIAVNARLGDIVDLRAPIAREPYGPPLTAAAPPATAGAPAAPPPPAPIRASRPAADLSPLPRPVPDIPNPGVGAATPAPPNPNAAPAPPPPAPPPTRSATVQPTLPPLPPPPPLPRPRPKLAVAQEPVEAPAEAPVAAPAQTPPAPPATKPPVPLRFSAPSAKDAGQIE